MNSIYLLAIISFGLVLAMVMIAGRLARLKANILFISIFATIIGLLIGSLAYLPLKALPGIFGEYLPIIFYVVSVAVSVWLFLARKEAITGTFKGISKIISIVSHPLFQLPDTMRHKSSKNATRQIVVDTSVLIDGRILDIVKTGFIPGKLIIPNFVLKELQHIADSEDQLRRAKGRRGLDVVQELKKEAKGSLQTVSVDFPEIAEVDSKLVHLAKLEGGDVMTNDYNLNKIAKIEGVPVLNVNELSQAMRPVIIPGEEMELKIIQAGKERHQGVGYLPDGTMIVVEEGDALVGQTIKVAIKRVLQTAAGKMYFATIKK